MGSGGKQASQENCETLMAEKKNESYADVINYIRTRLRFSMLKSVLVAIRGVRGKYKKPAPISTLSFNLIDTEYSEC